jgi:hypothetical protein
MPTRVTPSLRLRELELPAAHLEGNRPRRLGRARLEDRLPSAAMSSIDRTETSVAG